MKNFQIDMDAYVLNKPVSETMSGGKIFSSLPPFYIPENLSVETNATHDVLYLTFHYTNDSIERYDTKELSSTVSIELGKKSGRIHKLVLVLDKNHVTDKREHVDQMNQHVKFLLEKSENIKDKHFRNSFSATKSVFENYGDQVFSLAN